MTTLISTPPHINHAVKIHIYCNFFGQCVSCGWLEHWSLTLAASTYFYLWHITYQVSQQKVNTRHTQHCQILDSVIHVQDNPNVIMW